MNILIKNIKYLFITLLLSGGSYVFAYTMPIGVPESTLNFTQDKPARPNDWNNEIAGYYYIDQINGSKTVTFGSESAPLKKLPTNIPAGSYIEIVGEYALSGTTTIIANGTDDTWVPNISGPVWITTTQTSKGYFSLKKMIFTGANLFVSDLAFKGGAYAQIGSTNSKYAFVNNLVFRGNDVDGGNIAGTGMSIQRSDNVVVYNNKIHEMGTANILNEETGIIGAEADEDSHTFTIKEISSNIWLLDNEMFNASGSGLQVIGSSETTRNIYVAKNNVHNVRQSGLWVKYAKDVVFSSNHVHNIITRNTLTGGGSPAKGMGAQYEPNGFWMINNHIHGAEYGIRLNSYKTLVTKIYMIGNVIHDIRPVQSQAAIDKIGGPDLWQSTAINVLGGDEVHVYNNLIFDAPNGISGGAPAGGLYIKNNVIFNLTNTHDAGEYGRGVWAEYGTINTDIFMSNNYFDENMLVEIKKYVFTTPQLLTEFGSLNNIKGPQFLSEEDIEDIMDNTSISGFDLSTVVGKGTGVADVLIAEFSKVFPSLINEDVLGMARVQGGAIDIGPFEQEGSQPPATIPIAPGGVTVIQAQ